MKTDVSRNSQRVVKADILSFCSVKVQGMQPCTCHGVRTAGNATAVAGKNGGASLRYGRVFLIIIYPDFNPFFGSMFFPLKNMLHRKYNAVWNISPSPAGMCGHCRIFLTKINITLQVIDFYKF
ncbi:hypothetical protein [Janthinobacterium sp.]|uniref:hypothetical protein n=1 Tax=Janthinobacterium sp. TaxID=1871054 RepID=UPI0025C6A6A9|nr:hypothetical protein [Janthinobacterium sp.]